MNARARRHDIPASFSHTFTANGLKLSLQQQQDERLQVLQRLWLTLTQENILMGCIDLH